MITRTFIVGLFYLFMVRSAVMAVGIEPTAEEVELFERAIRPLLHDHCFACHSATAEKLRAGLLLDSRAGMLQGGDSGPAVVPRRPDDSLLVQAVRYESIEMPPSGKLDPRDIDQLERWIALGAPWPDEVSPVRVAAESFDWRARMADHWAWQSACSSPDGLRTIDQFLDAAMADRGLTPAAEAPRHVLIRRAWFDLIGLPPAPADMDRWIHEPSVAWFERMVDELLASPHFGEKWARHWLDLVRYAESCGHEYDYPIHEAYRYRNYLIRAWNADVPYHEFVREHIAGDLLPAPRRHPVEGFNESIIGTGFWFLGESVHAPTDVRGDEADRMANQIDVFSKTFLGTTVACARCHDHKFDPIPTEDYYALAGYLQSSRRQMAPLDPHGNIQRVTRQIADLRQDADAGALAVLKKRSITPERFRVLLDEWYASLAADEVDDNSLAPTHPLYVWWRMHQARRTAEAAGAESWQAVQAEISRQQTAADQFQLQSIHFPGPRPHGGWSRSGFAFDLAAESPAGWDWFRSDCRLSPIGFVDSGRYGKNQQGVLRSPTFTLNHRRVHHRLRGKGQVRLVVDGYYMREFHELLFADCSLPNVDTQGVMKWVTQVRDLQHYLGHRVWLEYHDLGNDSLALGEIRFSNEAVPADPVHPWSQQFVDGPTPNGRAELADRLHELWRETWRRWTKGEGTAADADVIDWWLGVDPNAMSTCISWREQLTALDGSLPAPMYVLAMADGTGENEHVFVRGNHANLGDEVARRLPVVMDGETAESPETGSGRLAMANRLIHSDSMLLRRVIVNRIWHHLFGRSIVPTVDDMGVMGQPPSHPELLDWLAEDHARHGWSLKHTIRTIVCSAAYRRRSKRDDPELQVLDPDNRWLAQYPRRRLSAEAIRDAMLSVSGRLDTSVLGPSIPIHLTPFLDGRGRPKGGPLDGAGRRSIYLSVRRNFLSPMMLAFDAPIPCTTIGRRNQSNVPAQSLFLMNAAFVTDQAARWSQRLQAEYPNSASRRLQAAFRSALGRYPTSSEVAELRDFMADQSPAEAWHKVCHLILNMKDFLYVE